MISLYSGTVGSGKSYHALLTGLQHVHTRTPYYVVANFDIRNKDRKESERWFFWPEIKPIDLISFSFEKGFFGQEGRCLLIIDEAGVIFNSRDWTASKKERVDWINFFSQSRKFGYDIILVAQDDRMIDRQIRGLIEFNVVHFNMRKYWFLSFLPFRFHTAVYRWYHTKMKGSVDPFIIRKKYYSKYDSMKLFNIDDIIETLKKNFVVIPADIAKVINFYKEQDAERSAVGEA